MNTVARTFEAYGETFIVVRTPPTLLLSELARTGSGDPSAIGVLAEFFEVILGPVEYRRFKRLSYAVEDPEIEGDLFQEAFMEAMEAISRVPSE